MLVDANVLLYAVDRASPHHNACSRWLADMLPGRRRVGLPWQSIGAFLRIATQPRVLRHPLSATQAWTIVDHWLSAPASWIPETTLGTARILGELMNAYAITGNLVPDAQLAALALEHGVPVVSADTDFARFSELSWINPLDRQRDH